MNALPGKDEAKCCAEHPRERRIEDEARFAGAVVGAGSPVWVEETLPPGGLRVEPRDKVKVKVSAVRKGGYQGPIGVEVRNFPANVTAPKATIAMAQTQVEIEVTAAANAVPAEKADVNVLGTATAAGNQQNASPNFTVSVVKK